MSTVSFKYPLQTLSIGPMVCFTLDIIRLDSMHAHRRTPQQLLPIKDNARPIDVNL